MKNFEGGYCAACAAPIGAATTRRCRVKGSTLNRELQFFECASCGFSHAPSNFHEYGSETDFGIESRVHDRHDRVGTSSRPGREYAMALLGIDILSRAGLNTRHVLIYGPGLSMDHLWISRRWTNAQVHICDLKNFQGADNFLEIDTPKKFDLVIACEVVEHFVDVRQEFERLLTKVTENGLAVLSTNIQDNSPIESLIYPFIPGHTAYYSGRALNAIGRRVDPRMHVDFRTPEAAVAQLGTRKRYVLMYRNPEIAQATSEYFAANFMAPSEKAEHTVPVRLGYWLHSRFPNLSNSLSKALRR